VIEHGKVKEAHVEPDNTGVSGMLMRSMTVLRLKTLQFLPLRRFWDKGHASKRLVVYGPGEISICNPIVHMEGCQGSRYVGYVKSSGKQRHFSNAKAPS
jgi:hypothetical protein